MRGFRGGAGSPPNHPTRLHRCGIAIPGPVWAANRAATSKQPHFFRHRRRFGCFPVTSVTGVRAPGARVNEFSAGTRPAENDLIFFFRLAAEEPEKTGGFFLALFPDLRELGENCYLVLDILARIKYNTRCVPKTAGGVSRKSCRGRQTCFAIRPCVFAHRDGSFFERTDNFPGGEH